MRILSSLCFVFIIVLCSGQSKTPGDSYFDSYKYAELIQGNMPIIISIPHGGDSLPKQIPDRNCTGCVYLKDSKTRELGLALADEIFKETGCYPYVVINHLHRIKLDANREIIEAADSNAIAEDVWHFYHTSLATARLEIMGRYGSGLLVDIHGHAHSKQRIELGYLHSKSELRKTDFQINSDSLNKESSVKSLYNQGSHSYSQLLRGQYSFGEYLNSYGYEVVPSPNTPAPDSLDPYFSGGFITKKYGSSDSGSLNAIQIECQQDLRFIDSNRTQFALHLAKSIDAFMIEHTFSNGICHVGLESSSGQSKSFFIFDAQTQSMRIVPDKVKGNLVIYNLLGQEIKTWDAQLFSLKEMQTGIYVAVYKEGGKILQAEKIVIWGE